MALDGAHVVAPATHDTGSAVAGAPLAEGWAYISSGTWSLVGVERAAPLVNADVARANFTNEGGAYGTIRFLKNVMGLWILERCRKEWDEDGVATGYDRLLAEVAGLDRSPGLIFPDDPRLLNPPRMTAAIAQQMGETGQAAPVTPAAIAKVVLDSLALRYASVVRTIEVLTGQTIAGVQIVGGGGQNDYLSQAAADATSRPVVAGPVEATVIGNVLVQAVTAGRFTSLAGARRHVADRIQPRRFEPRPPAGWADAARRYRELEARYL
jgi:rhamnulokinase